MEIGSQVVDEVSQQNRRVLIVDDNVLVLEVLRGMVECNGWQAECVRSGEQALELMQKSDASYEVILMDWLMPGIDGMETTRRIRQLKQSNQATPVVIMVTAHGREMLAESSSDDSELLDGFLVKPITASMLRDSVAEALKAGGHSHGKEALLKGSQCLQGMRLLVVEDNVLNQQVALELLEAHGAKVTLASGGIEGKMLALSAVVPFDAILMDLQMPDMDGLEATRQIQQNSHMLSVPIVAMTANAMQSDKDACLAAGMVGHIGKPIELNDMLATILRHTGPAKVSKSIAVEESVVSDSNKVLNYELAIKRINGNRDLYERLMGAFRTESQAHFEGFQQGIKKGDMSVAGISLHSLKGMAGTMGAENLQQLASDIEEELKSISIDRVTEVMYIGWIKDIESSLFDVVSALDFNFSEVK